MNQRLKFFLCHLLISIIIALIVTGIIFFIWYPSPLAQAAGVTHLFIMLILIDLIVGPLMTLLIYKKDINAFKMDLSIIIIIQISALVYGLHSITQGRPAWIVFNQNKFELIRVNDQFIENTEHINEKFQNISWTGPQYVAAIPSQNMKQREDDLFMDALGGVSLAQRPERYVTLSHVKQEIQQQSKDLDNLKKFNDVKLVEKILKQYPEATAYLPLKANKLDMVILLNKKEGSIVNIVNLRPWE
ncbi:TfpX/TfpZ family type IV pilin accessory protein [Acinetobacter sp. WCHAc010052]|uniref:TfpX/TfpZ family type IV pilin accessory protein n=1 Tax=Acinetobacter sp. WCHAc010052 TaxID=2004647 RepID=UPI000B3C70BC|nr:TfpX/TfpZ family type IV pilin accessory protein [Acinetobacter sp. WCHAc010052]AXY58910.1 type IV pilin accessory protein [Acinetobacter sp. WCHAc010052]